MHKKNGFTLIELSLVLIIIGLLFGGITTGISLVKSARIQSVISSTTERIRDIKTFQTKYKSYPGDMIDASSNFTGATDGNGNDWINGNGDPNYEDFLAWKQIEMSGIASYDGMSGTGTVSSFSSASPNVPNTALATVGIGIATYNGKAADGTPNGNTSNALLLASQGSHNTTTVTFGLTSHEAYIIDKKTDDGRPFSGKVIGNGAAGSCIDSATIDQSYSSPHYYLNLDNGPACYMQIMFGNFLRVQ
jgi:prepilin-type N-terminal cleavage/methylation domain-containing protein